MLKKSGARYRIPYMLKKSMMGATYLVKEKGKSSH